MKSILKQPSAWFPIALSIMVMAAWGIGLKLVGIPAREPDEGIAAHLFQIWLAVEVLMIMFFAIKWLPEKPKPVALILLIQIVSVLAACFPVFYFKL